MCVTSSYNSDTFCGLDQLCKHESCESFTDTAYYKKQRHDSDHSSLSSSTTVEKNITSIPDRQVSEAPVNRTLTVSLKPNSDSMLSPPAPIQTAELRQDRNRMRTIPKSAIVARGPSYLAMKRMSWSPANDKKGSEASKTKRNTKRLKLLVPERYIDLLKHDEAVYSRWEQCYKCFYHYPMTDIFLCANKKPSLSEPALIPLVPNVSMSYEELEKMSQTTDWKEGDPVPVFSKDLITKFLARVHAFTAVDLEAQATAFSDGPDGISTILLYSLKSMKLVLCQAEMRDQQNLMPSNDLAKWAHIMAPDYSAPDVGSTHIQDSKLSCH